MGFIAHVGIYFFTSTFCGAQRSTVNCFAHFGGKLSVRHFPPDSRQANETHAVQGFCIYIVVELEDCWLFEQSFNLRRDCSFKIA
jgi:hypothetical protein